MTSCTQLRGVLCAWIMMCVCPQAAGQCTPDPLVDINDQARRECTSTDAIVGKIKESSARAHRDLLRLYSLHKACRDGKMRWKGRLGEDGTCGDMPYCRTSIEEGDKVTIVKQHNDPWNPTADQAEALRLTNIYRAKHNAPPLTLDPMMNQAAQKWADELAGRGGIQHSQPDDRPYQGETVAANRGQLDPVSAAINGWYAEVETYEFSGTGENALHFTQMIWKSTRKLGFGIATSPDGKTYIVARYCPAGNIQGEYEKNVQRASDDVV